VSQKQPSNLALRFGTIAQIFGMLKRTRRWWMVPMLTIMVLLGLALSGLQAVQYVAPFIYAVF
jgi:predicted alpha/beta hydrolase